MGRRRAGRRHIDRRGNPRPPARLAPSAPRDRAFWYALDRAAKQALQRPGERIAVNDRVAFVSEEDFLFMVLPSGRRIAYPDPRLQPGDRGEPVVMFKDNAGGKWVDCRYGHGAYGGTWTENAVQATARDLLAAALLRPGGGRISHRSARP